MGLQCHSKTIPNKPSFSKSEPPFPKKVTEIPRKILGIESTSCRVEESIESQSSVLSKHISLKPWLFHLDDDLELYQSYSPRLKWNRFFTPSLAFPEHLLSARLCTKLVESEMPKDTCLSQENSANQEGYR